MFIIFFLNEKGKKAVFLPHPTLIHNETLIPIITGRPVYSIQKDAFREYVILDIMPTQRATYVSLKCVPTLH